MSTPRGLAAALAVSALLVTGLTVSACGSAAKAPAAATSTATAGSSQRWSQPPAMAINVNKSYTATLRTSLGNITIQLLAKQAPNTVNNFVFLAQHNFYNGDRIFRIIKNFMFQTGDPNNNGTGGPGYHFADELPPALPYGPGIVAMANAGPNTNGSQFFVCTAGPDCAGLNQTPNYTVFGKVTSGMSVVAKIAAVPVTTNPVTNEVSMPTNPPVITSVTISVGS
jgi:cyclophilin family peptidyl-prolyl cis-trans isomerase